MKKKFLKNCEGLSIDYTLLNASGFLFLAIFTLYGAINPEVGRPFEISVLFGSIYSFMVIMVSTIIFTQALIYQSGKPQDRMLSPSG